MFNVLSTRVKVESYPKGDTDNSYARRGDWYDYQRKLRFAIRYKICKRKQNVNMFPYSVDKCLMSKLPS